MDIETVFGMTVFGTTALQVGQDGCSAVLWLVDQHPLIAGSHQVVSVEHKALLACSACLWESFLT